MQTEMIQINNNFFNEQLFKMLCDNDDDDEDNLCLITNNILENDHITLDCKHKFNYSAIFNEIKNQKLKKNYKEIQYLSLGQIKCPYCRFVQKGLLPDRTDFPNIKGVNWPKSLQFKPNNCEYIFLSGKKKNTTCNKKCHGKYCSSHQKIMEKRLNKQLKTSINNDIKQKNKTEFPTNTCSYVFKRGKNKGLQCKCKKIFENGYCKTHYKSYYPNSVVNNNKIGNKNNLIKELEQVNTNFKIENLSIKGNKTIIKYNKNFTITV